MARGQSSIGSAATGRFVLLPNRRGSKIWGEISLPRSQSSPNVWTDSYPAAFAKATGYTLVTFDRGFASFSGIPLRILTDAP
jgi:predicted nucleic acid-binding protein